MVINSIKILKKWLTEHIFLVYEGAVFVIILAVLGALYLRLPVTIEVENEEIMPMSSISIRFKRPASNGVKYRLVPEVKGDWVSEGSGPWITSVMFIPKENLVPGKTYELVLDQVKPVVSIGRPIQVERFNLNIKSPSAVASVSPINGATNSPIDSRISLVLSEPNNGLRKLKAESNAELKSSYPTTDDDKTFYWDFKNSLSRDSDFSYKIIDEYQSDKGSLVSNTFKTVPGKVVVSSLSPSGGAVSLNQRIIISFNQAVDRRSAEKLFYISPKVTGNFSWEGNDLIYTPNSQLYGTSYIFGLNAGVVSVYGLPSDVKYSASYSTDYKSTKLNTPSYLQQYRLSCEESALRMALGYRGVATTDWDILQKLGYSPRDRNTTNNTWDDPYVMFVGDANGKIGVNGWGAYAAPIALAAKTYGVDAEAVVGISSSQIALAISSDNPVVLYGIIGSSVDSDSWTTESGKVINAPKNAHARLVYGFKGDASNPLGFYLHDPLFGDLYWSKNQLEWNMTFAGTLSSQAVIVK